MPFKLKVLEKNKQKKNNNNKKIKTKDLRSNLKAQETIAAEMKGRRVNSSISERVAKYVSSILNAANCIRIQTPIIIINMFMTRTRRRCHVDNQSKGSTDPMI